MTLTAADLDDYWRQLPPPSALLLEAREVGRWPAGQILVAVDADGQRHLLVAVPDQPRTSLTRLRGVESQYRHLRAAGHEGIWLDLQLLDGRGADAFGLLCSDIITDTEASLTPDPTIIATVVRRWRRFWSNVPEGMDHESRLGLFGELWLLTRWLPAVTTSAINSWQGPLGGRHDFADETVSVEVKTSGSGTGPLIHRITSLGQLATPDRGQLYLLSLRVVAEATGVHTLDALVTESRQLAEAAGSSAADELDQRLARYGWSPLHRGRYADPVRIVDQALYHVDDTFPRLVPGLLNPLPDGIVDVKYSLDTTVCGPWRIASRPSDPGPLDHLSR